MSDTIDKTKAIEVLQKYREQYAGNPQVDSIYLIADIENDLGLN